VRRPPGARASLEAAIPLPYLRRALGVALLSGALLPAASHADLYRWTDAEGVTHYAPGRERVPRAYRDSAVLVKATAAPVEGPLPPVQVPPPRSRPEPDAADLEEPGPGQRPVDAGPQQPSAPAAETREAPVEPAAPGAETVPAADDLAAAEADPRQAELAALERELAARREELKNLISESSFDSSQVATNPRLSELAELVPRLQAEVEALRKELER
jgi:hypothetical protein